MNFSSFKLDIDELIEEFVMEGSTTFAAMKRVWLSKKFSYIYEARPSTNLAAFMQLLYAHTIGYMIGTASLLHRLAGLYCLYCLYETQPFKPPIKIYISIGQLKQLKELVVEAKEKDIKVVHVLIKSMLRNKVFLVGSVDLNDGFITETLNKLTEVQNARIQVAYEKLFTNTKIDDFLNMNLGMEVNLDVLKKMSMEYADAKKQAITEASEEVDVRDMQHISDDKEPIGGVVEKICENWNASRELFYEQTGQNQRMALEVLPQPVSHEDQEDDDFDRELELLLSQT